MRNFIDEFYEHVHKNSLKRRRMVSLLLVMSMFVSTGVLWELRDTGITMVNDVEEYDASDHIHTMECYGDNHTEECYSDVLICEDESEEHTHTDECYERKLVCEDENHLYMLCDETDDDAEESEDDLEEVVIYCPSSDEESEDEENDDAEDDEENPEDDEDLVEVDAEFPDVMLDSEPQVMASEKPPTIQTVDNIAEGIKFTLFDYGGSELESKNNNYDFDGTWSNGTKEITKPYAHSKVVTSGINTGRDIAKDILFFAYGTPVPSGIMPAEGEAFYNYTDENGQHYQPDKNSYAGDYNAKPAYSGNRAVQGIVQNTLGADGYPHVVGSDNTLKYLFDDTTADYKQVYSDVNHLLKSVKGPKGVEHLVYNSDQNYAYFDKSTNEFEVYNKTFEIINDNHHKAGDVNNIKLDDNENPIKYETDVDPGFKIGFFPFDEYDDTRRDPNYDGNGYNHHFGMTMEAKFTNNEFDGVNVKEPITFKYSGDDDMWVYVDGKLVLDLGGIHEPAGGMIDFSNGLVWTQDNGATGNGKTLDAVKQDLINQGYVADDAEWDEFPKPIGVNTSLSSVDKWIVESITLEKYLPEWKNDGKKYGEHEIKMFYLERGGCYSNLAMEMNLPTLKPLSVIKNVDYKDHFDNTYDNAKYWFQVYEWNNTDNVWEIPDDEVGKQFAIANGERKKFDNLGQGREFKVVEVGYSLSAGATGPEYGIDGSVFDVVTAYDKNNQLLNVTRDNGTAATDGALLSNINSYTFNNTIRQDTKTLKVKKDWDCIDEKRPDDFIVKFKILRTDSVTGEVKQIALKEEDKNTGKMVKRRTFTISPAKWNDGVDISGLPTQYGNHYYTYKVEELNTPNGFKAAYGYDDSGNITITNTDTSKMEINVEKKWENIESNGRKVQLRLTRTRVGYAESQPTSLKIRILDEGDKLDNELGDYGNFIKELTIGSSENKIFAGGSAELAYVLPEGVELYEAVIEGKEYPNYFPDTLSVTFDDGILILDNLAAEKTPGTIANEVTFKVRTTNAKDDIWLLHHSFTRGTDGWDSNGGAKAGPSGSVPYAKGNALVITDRTKAWQGARLYLDPALFKANKTYTFTTYVYSPVADDFKFTFNNGLGTYTPLKQENAGYFSVPANTWTPITGVLRLPENIDPYNMFIIVETKPVDDDGNCKEMSGVKDGNKFYIDEFVAIEGNNPVEVKPGTGEVVISGAPVVDNTVKYSIKFSGTLTDEWIKNGSFDISGETGNNNYMRIYNRGSDGAGIQKSVSSILKAGHRYKFDIGYQRDGASGSDAAHLTLNYKAGNGDQKYTWVCNTNISDTSDNHYVHYNSSQYVEIPADADLTNARIYFETNSEDTKSFRVRNLTITDVTQTIPSVSGNVDGYTIENGKYVTDYSNYGISLDENSVTNPLHLDEDGYVPDEEFRESITLPNDDGSWTYHWDNKTILEDHKNYLYKYQIEEISVDGEDNVFEGVDKKYEVTYTNNDVATNDTKNPILVTNKYIWYKLPATGGIGTKPIYLLGTVLTMAGILSGCNIYRRKRRQDEMAS